MTNGPTLPAVVEADATGETADIFADLRATLDVPFVNLIWRHLATIPGMLPWTWSIVKPLHHSMELEQASAELMASSDRPKNLALPGCVFEAAGIDAAARTTIGALVRNYNRGNAYNLLTLLVVRWLLEGRPNTAARALTYGTRAPAGALSAPTVVLPPFASLTPTLQELVLDLDQFGRTAPSTAVASRYMHVSHWPGFLGLLYAVLVTSHRSGLLRAAHVETLHNAQSLVQRHLLPAVAGTPPPAGVGRSMALAGVDQFTTQMIARMLTIGTVILTVLPNAET